MRRLNVASEVKDEEGLLLLKLFFRVEIPPHSPLFRSLVRHLSFFANSFRYMHMSFSLGSHPPPSPTFLKSSFTRPHEAF